MADTTQQLSQWELPPIGKTIGSGREAELIQFYRRFAWQVSGFRDPWLKLSADNRNIFAYGEPTNPTVNSFVVNQIQGNVISNVAGEIPRGKLEAGESADQPKYYWRGPQQIGLLLGLQPPQLADWQDPFTGQQRTPAPMDEQQAENWLQQSAMGVPVQTPFGAVDIKEEWIVTVDAETTVDFFQDLVDVQWTRCELDQDVRDAKLHNAVDGWVCWPFDWDDDKLEPIVRQIPPEQAHLDIKSRLRLMGQAAVDLVGTLAEFRNLYPELAGKLADLAKSGSVPIKTDANVRWAVTEDRIRYEPTLTLRIGWIKDQWMPMDEDEALAKGHVELRPAPQPVQVVPPTPAPALGAPDGSQAHEQAETPEQEQDEHATGQEAPDESPNAVVPAQGLIAGNAAGGGNLGGVGDAPVAPPPPPDLRHYIPGSDLECPPQIKNDQGEMIDNPMWPRKRVIRQTIMVMPSAIVWDGPCPFDMYPLLHMVNIASLSRPWGFGEPYRQYPLQKAFSRSIKSMVDAAENASSPAQDMPELAYNNLTDEERRSGFKNNTIRSWPMAIWNAVGGKVRSVVEAPNLPAALSQLYDILKDTWDRIAGRPDVKQGIAPPGVKAGVAIQQLQAEADQPDQYKQEGLNFFVERLALLIHQCHLKLNAQQIMQISDKYPLHIVEAFLDRGRALKWNTKVEALSNSAAANRKANDVYIKLQNQIIDLETAQIRLNEDPALIRRRKKAAAMSEAMMMPQAPPGNGSPPQPQQAA